MRLYNGHGDQLCDVLIKFLEHQQSIQPLNDQSPTKREKLVAQVIDTLKSKRKITSVLSSLAPFRFRAEQLMSYGLQLPKYQLKIFSKSDPQAMMTGSEAPSCMGFGSGKNNVYMFNLNTGYFATLKAIEGDPNGLDGRILATSVVTADRKIPALVPTVVEKVKKSIEDNSVTSIEWQSILGDDFLSTISKQTYLGVDNVEGASAQILKGNGDIDFNVIVERLYRHFFTKYFSKHPETRRGRPFDTSKLVVGTAYSDFMKQLPKEDNHYMMQAPVAYSDKLQKDVGYVSLETNDADLSSSFLDFKGVLPLYAEDTLEVSYVENEAFRGKPFKNHLAGLEMELQALEYNEADKGLSRRNLSLGYFEKGVFLGYTIANIGYNSDSKSDFIYISDFAVFRKGGRAAGAIIKTLFKTIGDSQLWFDKNNKGNLPVVFEATDDEHGSYWMLFPKSEDDPSVKKHKEARLKKYGYSIKEHRKIGDGRVSMELERIS